MDKIVELLEKAFENSGLDELSILLLIVSIIVISLMFKYFLNQRKAVEEEESSRISKTLEKYSEAITAIIEYKEENIKESDLIIKLSGLLPICSNGLKRLILDYHEIMGDDVEESIKIEKISEMVIKDYESLRLNDKSNVFKKLGSSIFDNIGYAYNYSGMRNILSAIGLTLLSLFSILFALAFSSGFVQSDTTIKKVYFMFAILYVIIYFMILVMFVDVVSTIRMKNGIRSIVLIALTFTIPLTTLFIPNMWLNVASFIIFLALSFYVFRNEIKRKLSFEQEVEVITDEKTLAVEE